MAARLSALLPRMVALTLIWLLATSTVTFAAAGRAPRKAPPLAPPAPKAIPTLVVPDVRRQAYVFAKGILEDGGFAWRVHGAVAGYAANTVSEQRPAPGTKVVDTGSPTIVVTLARNPSYPERGLPENRSPHDGTKLVLVSKAGKKPAKPAVPAKPAKPAVPAKPEAPEAPEAPAGQPTRAGGKQPKAGAGREPAFHVAGAPTEPLDEMPLPARAQLLERRLSAAPRPTPELVRYWLYQHSWVVTGAKFGWSGGAEALRILVAVDRDLQGRWGVGARSEAVARATLADVRRHAGR
jgi:PASTA domain